MAHSVFLSIKLLSLAFGIFLIITRIFLYEMAYRLSPVHGFICRARNSPLFFELRWTRAGSRHAKGLVDNQIAWKEEI